MKINAKQISNKLKNVFGMVQVVWIMFVLLLYKHLQLMHNAKNFWVHAQQKKMVGV